MYAVSPSDHLLAIVSEEQCLQWEQPTFISNPHVTVPWILIAKTSGGCECVQICTQQQLVIVIVNRIFTSVLYTINNLLVRYGRSKGNTKSIHHADLFRHRERTIKWVRLYVMHLCCLQFARRLETASSLLKWWILCAGLSANLCVGAKRCTSRVYWMLKFRSWNVNFPG